MERRTFTLAYRMSPRATTVRRIDLSLTWREARELARRRVETAGGCWIKSARWFDATPDSYEEDRNNVLNESTGKRLRCTENGKLSDLGIDEQDVHEVEILVRDGRDAFSLAVDKPPRWPFG